MNAAVYRDEAARELQSILRYWMLFTPDEINGGFIGRIDANDKRDYSAPKGLVLNSRILWTFSAAWRYTGQWIYRAIATRAYDYLCRYFFDPHHGGAFWSLDASGKPLDCRKQIYGHAFAIYGLSEYYRATGEQTVLDQAIGLYRLIEQHSYDPVHQGYFEAFGPAWTPVEDRRLSEKDANEPKTMNTQLHVLEAYTNLYRAWPDVLLRKRIIGLLGVFTRNIVDGTTGHLGLFFAEDWRLRSKTVSYGHDIEAAWLLHEAALAIEDQEIRRGTEDLALRIAAAAAEGLDTDGGLWYERENGMLIPEKHWWPQAEAMTGFLRAWVISGDDRWWQRSVAVWSFVKRYIRHPLGREWYWGITAHHSPITDRDKAGFWKCPYHNSRACLEIMRMLKGYIVNLP